MNVVTVQIWCCHLRLWRIPREKHQIHSSAVLAVGTTFNMVQLLVNLMKWEGSEFFKKALFMDITY